MEDKSDLEVFTKTGKLRTRARAMPPLTDEQSALAARWHRYAIKVAYDRAHRPCNDADVWDSAHLALVRAARYYQPDKGHKTFGTFYCRCLRQITNRKYKRRMAKLMGRLPIAFIEDGHHEYDVACPEPRYSPETVELANHVLNCLPARERELLRDYYMLGINTTEAAAKTGRSRQAAWREVKEARDVARRLFA